MDNQNTALNQSVNLISTNGVMIEKIDNEEYGEKLMKIYLQLQEQSGDEDMDETDDVDMTM